MDDNKCWSFISVSFHSLSKFDSLTKPPPENKINSFCFLSPHLMVTLNFQFPLLSYQPKQPLYHPLLYDSLLFIISITSLTGYPATAGVGCSLCKISHMCLFSLILHSIGVWICKRCFSSRILDFEIVVFKDNVSKIFTICFITKLCSDNSF